MKSSARINGIWISAPMPKISRCTITLTSDGRLCQSQTARWYSSRSIRSLRSAARAISVGLQSGNFRKTQESKVRSRILEAGTMLTIDQTEQRKSGDQRCSVRSDRIAVDDMVQSQPGLPLPPARGTREIHSESFVWVEEGKCCEPTSFPSTLT